ncbi:MAG: zinc-binding dehydrogenase [Actinomycetota bacterium]|nr:zinc-binding dehydrogenase [Actinomycetota bacterium]
MKALVYERSLPRFAAARVASGLAAGAGARVGPLRLADVDEPALPGPGWHRVRPRLAGICGSDLATVDARSSRWFEGVVSFPFVPGHEVVGDLDDGTRVVLEPVLACAARGIDPPCPACAAGANGNCERIAFGALAPGLQTGYCADTGGGWSHALVAHESQLHRVPEDMSDEAAVMVEPTACAAHAVVSADVPEGAVVAVLGAGTLGLCTVAALRRLALPGTVIAAAKHPEQRRLAAALGADVVVDPAETARAVRRHTRSLAVDDRLTGGADVVVDCVGSEDSLAQALAVVRPRGTIVLVGMPGSVRVDLTPLWQREVRLAGSYAYRSTTFATAFDLVAAAGLERLVSARYPLERWREALDHAASAGRRGAVKIAFDLRTSKRSR